MENKFYVGAATAAHQVEGNNTANDFWAMEQMKYTTFSEPSGRAVDHFNRYEEDIRLMAQAGLTAYRFSIEWARIEPREGEFDSDALLHYSRVIDCCHANRITPFITLHHFTSPAWLMEKGGWEDPSVVGFFARYVSYIAEHLGHQLSFVCTINEANIGLQIADIARRYEKKIRAATSDGTVQMGMNLEKMLAAKQMARRENIDVFGTEEPHYFTSVRSDDSDEIVMQAHRAAMDILRQKAPHVRAGLTLSLHDIQSVPGGEAIAAAQWEKEFTHYLPYINGDDFLGVQNYTRAIYDANGQMTPPKEADLTQMGYENDPEALEHVLRKVADKFKSTLYVTENGIACTDDQKRCIFIKRALDGVYRCRKDHIPVQGYFYWSLLDNFEWQKGFSMTFGLIGVDRSTMNRSPKKSLTVLGKEGQELAVTT